MTVAREKRIYGYIGISSSSIDSMSAAVTSEQSNLNIIHVVSKLKPDMIPFQSEEKKIEITQWFTFSQQLEISDLNFLNNYLLLNSFISLHQFTVADIVMFDAVVEIILANPKVHLNYSNICRWLELISTSNNVNCMDKIKSLFVIQKNPTAIFLPSTENQDNTKTQINGSKDKDSKVLPDDKTSSKDKKESKVKKEKTVSSSSGTVVSNISDTENKTEKDEDLDPSKLDIRVGKIVKCWNHPESEKLLCEEIDVGESSGARSIASGLRAHYTAEEMEGKLVIVLANLKERPMAGFKSQGMVLCACNPDHTVVKLVEPPANSTPGDKITFPGYTGEPAPANQVAKKKILEKLAPFLKTDDKGIAHWGTVPFTLAGGLCTSSLPNATVS